MKIFNVINNYGREGADSPFGGIGGNGCGETPDWFEVPDSSVLKTRNPFFVPDFDTDFQFFPSIVYRIGRLGKSIARRFAGRYTESVGIGGAIVATGLLERLRAAGMPWTRATAFDRCCILGNLVPIDSLIEMKEVRVECGASEIVYRAEDLRHGIETIIELISADNTLKNGDLVFAGLAPRGLPLKPGTRLTATNANLLLDINIK